MVRELPPEARPREKLLARGPQALADAELLALLLRTGTAEQPVLALAQSLLQRFGGLSGLLQATPAALAPVKGLGPAKRAELLAVTEMVRRALAERLRERPVLDSPQAVADVLRLQIAHRPHEVFAVLFLDNQHRLIALEELFRGTLDQTSVYPREVALRALHHHAAAVILAHNHPSGAREPSRADAALTATLKGALGLLDIRLLDHLIVTREGCTSMAERGLV